MDYIENRMARLENILMTLLYEHPEICPHEWEWQCSVGNSITYKCSLCGTIIKEGE